MLSGKTYKSEIRGYVCPIPGLPIPVQRRMAADANCRHVYEAGPLDTGGLLPRDRWMQSLRPGDTAWLPSIRCLILPAAYRPQPYRHVADVCRCLNMLLATGVIIVDAKARVTSEDPEAWANHVYQEGLKISAGIRPEHVRKRAYKAAEAAREPGVTARWLAPAMAEQLERQRVIWTGAGSLERVMRQLDPDLRGRSSRTLYEILGQRRPGDPGAGGRGKKRKRK